MDLSSGPLACRMAPTSMNCVVHWEIHGAYRAGVSGGVGGLVLLLAGLAQARVELKVSALGDTLSPCFW